MSRGFGIRRSRKVRMVLDVPGFANRQNESARAMRRAAARAAVKEERRKSP